MQDPQLQNSIALFLQTLQPTLNFHQACSIVCQMAVKGDVTFHVFCEIIERVNQTPTPPPQFKLLRHVCVLYANIETRQTVITGAQGLMQQDLANRVIISEKALQNSLEASSHYLEQAYELLLKRPKTVNGSNVDDAAAAWDSSPDGKRYEEILKILDGSLKRLANLADVRPQHTDPVDKNVIISSIDPIHFQPHHLEKIWGTRDINQARQLSMQMQNLSVYRALGEAANVAMATANTNIDTPSPGSSVVATPKQ